MGAVYRAWDEELGVGVALKTVRPEIAKDPDAARDLEKRFKRELLLARQVTHPNVVRIHDMGEINGVKYITMPYACPGSSPPTARVSFTGISSRPTSWSKPKPTRPSSWISGSPDRPPRGSPKEGPERRFPRAPTPPA
jgi:hypothetical protein